jgi:nicotinate-nucleotide pyrophosphorylase (carboxylating)
MAALAAGARLEVGAFADRLYGVLPAHGELEQLVRAWMQSDAPDFDIGGFVVGDEPKEARLLGKSPGVLAGRPFVQAVFDVAGLECEWLCADGHEISAADAAAKRPVAIVRGPARKILIAERIALNVLSRASGIATLSRRMARLAHDSGWHGEVAATRKTTPGFALVEKYAVLVGGCSTHRMTLSQMVMLKDNHVWACGNDIASAVKKARRAAGFSCKIEVECRSLAEAVTAATAGAEVVMLDNYTPDALKEDARRLKEKFPHVKVEASGGITERTIGNFFSPHVDVVSMGKLTQGYDALDFSLKILQPDQHL